MTAASEDTARPGLWARWVRLTSHREDATSLAVSRMVIAYAVFKQLFTAWHSGAASAMWLEERFGGVRPLDRLGVLAWFGGASPRNVSALIVVGLLSSALMFLGAFGRVTTVLTWLIWRTAAGLNDQSGGSGDDLLVNVLFVLMFSQCSHALSLDARWFGRRWKDPTVPAWPRYVLIVQLVLMYIGTGMQKISASWVPWGRLDALWYILQQPTWQHIPMRWLAPVYPLTQLATLTTWIFEVSGPVLLLAFWYRATRDRPGRLRALFNRLDVRRVYLCIGVMLHVGIDLAMEVGPFLPGVLAMYACCIHPGEYRAMGRWIRRRFARTAPQESPVN